MNEFLNKLLDYLGLSEETYQTFCSPVRVDKLPHPTLFHNFEPFIRRIEKAIANQDQIVIYGDYDADGILATSILKYAFNIRGKDVFTMIPSRYKDGYGLNEKVVEKFINRGINLIITVDNGISAHKAILKAREAGIDVLVSDHHEIGETLPHANAIIHPDLCEGPSVNSCGAFMALLISYGLLGEYDPYLISLASIATIADMMPLVGRNRDLVKLGISYLNTANYLPLFKLNDSTYYDENTIGMKIAPRINALGRLSQNYEANVLVEYFTTSDTKRINDIYLYIIKIYEERKKMSQVAELSEEEVNNPAIITISDELEGVLGLLAQNYVSTYKKPAFVFTTSSEDAALLKGSVRSGNGFNVVESFTHLKDYIIQSGGHAEAGGLTIRKEDYPLFKKALFTYAKDHILVEKEEKYIDINKDELTRENYSYIDALAPFGFGFPRPKFRLVDAQEIPLSFSRDGNHIITTISQNMKLIGFNLVTDALKHEKYALYGFFSKSEFREMITIDFKIIKIESA